MNEQKTKELIKLFWDNMRRTILHACGYSACVHRWDGECHLQNIVIDENGKCLHLEE